MNDNQQGLFDEKKYLGVLPSPFPIVPPTADTTVIQTIPAYHSYLASGKFSKYTPDDFSGDIKKFTLYMKERKRFGFTLTEKKIKDITTGDIQQWIAELKKIMTRKTVSRKVSALNNYFLWLESNHAITKNPMQGIIMTRVTSPLPDILFEEQCNKLLATASNEPRSYLLFLLFIKTGITLEELRALKMQHVDFSNNYAPEMWVKYTGEKEHKDRKLKLPQEIKTVFDEYVKKYTISEILFPYTAQGIRFVMKQITQKADIKKKVSPQILRDSCAVIWLKHGDSIELVLQKLGLRETDEDARAKYEGVTKKAL